VGINLPRLYRKRLAMPEEQTLKQLGLKVITITKQKLPDIQVLRTQAQKQPFKRCLLSRQRRRYRFDAEYETRLKSRHSNAPKQWRVYESNDHCGAV